LEVNVIKRFRLYLMRGIMQIADSLTALEKIFSSTGHRTHARSGLFSSAQNALVRKLWSILWED